MKEEIIHMLEELNNDFKNRLISVDISDYVEKITKKATIIKRYNAEELIAFIAFYDNCRDKNIAFLSMLAVKSDYQNNQLGEQLLMEVIANLEKKGFIFFDLEVLSLNNKAVNFYKKHGFFILKISENHLVMRKHL